MTVRVEPTSLRGIVASTFEAVGFSTDSAAYIADSLVRADERGVHSHGVMLVPLYVQRVTKGLVATHDRGDVVVDGAAHAVIDARSGAGQLMARQAMALAIRKAKSSGIGAVGVHHSNHFGAAAPYVASAAEAGCLGVAVSTTTPLMPAPGGAQAVAGNNPMAFGIPRTDGAPIILDMALSEVAGGKIRYAASAGRPIPGTWATDRHGVPTTDPAQALQGLLLPMGAHKGFGLALVVDVLAGALVGGSSGADVRSIYRDLDHPNDCGHFMIALDIAHFTSREAYDSTVELMEKRVRSSARAPGVEELFLPGTVEDRAEARAHRLGVELEDNVLDALLSVAGEHGAATDLEVRE